MLRCETAVQWPRRAFLMQHEDFLTRSATTMELSIQGQELLAREIACAVRRLWRRLALAGTWVLTPRRSTLGG